VPKLPESVPTPSPYGKGLTDADLAQAYEDQRHAGNLAQIVNAGAALSQAVGGKTPLNAGDSFRAGADSQIKEIEARRAGVDQDFKATQARELAGTDSPEARFRQWLFQNMPQTKEVATQLGDRTQTVPADQLPALLDYLKAQKRVGGSGALSPAAPGWAEIIKANIQDPETQQLYLDSLKGMEEKGAQRAFGGLPGIKVTTGAQMNRLGVSQQGMNTRQTERVNVQRELAGAQRLVGLGKQITPQEPAAKQFINEMKAELPALEQAYPSLVARNGLDKIQNMFWQKIAGNDVASKLLAPDDYVKFARLADLGAIITRLLATGKVFRPEEDSEVRRIVADLSSGTRIKASIGRLEELMDGHLDTIYATHPHEVQQYLSQLPYMATARFRVDGAAPATLGLPRVESQSVVPPPESAPQASSKDDQMGEWVVRTLRQNPNDPDALAVKAKLERKGFRLTVKQ
jgi:hypothetical protein